MIHSMSRALLASLLILISGVLRAAPVLPLTDLVDERTMAVLSIADTPALLRGWDGSPFARTWGDAQVVKFFAPLREQIKIEEWDADAKAATGCTVRELLALAEGEALLAVPATDLSKTDKTNTPPFLLALRVGAHVDQLEKLLADTALKNEVREETEIFAGATVHVRPLKKTTEGAKERVLVWAIVDGTWLLSLEKERVFVAIDALRRGGVDGALGKSEPFLRVRERCNDAQVLFYLNVAALYPVLRDTVSAQAGTDGKPRPLGLDPKTVLSGLGIDAIGEAYGSLRFGEKETRIDFGLTYTAERGLLKLLAYGTGVSSQPNWIPAKWPCVSTARFDLGLAYAGLEELLASISPMLFGMAQGQIHAWNLKLGIDLKRDLVGSLGDEVVSGVALPPDLDAGTTPRWDQMDQLFAISLKNVEAFTKAIEALKQLSGPAADRLFTKRDYLGQTLYTASQQGPAGATSRRGLTYAIANRTVLIGLGSPATVENALQGMADNQGLFWKRDDIKAALADMPADISGIQFQDLRVLVASLFETIAHLQDADTKAKSSGQGKPFVDVSAKPDPEVIALYWGLASGYSVKTPVGIFGTTRIAYPQP